MTITLEALDNITNGELIKTMFPDCEEERRDDVIDVYGLSSFSVTFKTDWWDSKYKTMEGNNNG